MQVDWAFTLLLVLFCYEFGLFLYSPNNRRVEGGLWESCVCVSISGWLGIKNQLSVCVCRSMCPCGAQPFVTKLCIVWCIIMRWSVVWIVQTNLIAMFTVKATVRYQNYSYWLVTLSGPYYNVSECLMFCGLCNWSCCHQSADAMQWYLANMLLFISCFGLCT